QPAEPALVSHRCSLLRGLFLDRRLRGRRRRFRERSLRILKVPAISIGGMLIAAFVPGSRVSSHCRGVVADPLFALRHFSCLALSLRQGFDSSGVVAYQFVGHSSETLCFDEFKIGKRSLQILPLLGLCLMPDNLAQTAMLFSIPLRWLEAIACQLLKI